MYSANPRPPTASALPHRVLKLQPPQFQDAKPVSWADYQKVLPLTLFNWLFINVGLTYFSQVLSLCAHFVGVLCYNVLQSVVKEESAFPVDGLPTVAILARDLVLSSIINDVLFYYLHR